MITVALTSIPPRFDRLADRLSVIFAQGPDRLCLCLPHRYLRHPGWNGQLPDLPPGVDLIRCADHGPASKLLGASGKYSDGDILIADDDCHYAPGWLDAFRRARKAHPTAAIAASSFDTARLGLPGGHRIVQGFAGVLLPPLIVTPPEPPAQWVDDIWLSAQLAARHIPIVDHTAARQYVTADPAPDQLQDAIINGKTRADLNRKVALACQSKLGIWR